MYLFNKVVELVGEGLLSMGPTPSNFILHRKSPYRIDLVSRGKC